MRRVLDAHTLELELARLLGEPTLLRPSLTLILLRIEGRASAAAADPDLLGSLASVAAERLRRGDTVGLVDDSTFAVLLAGATPAAAASVASHLGELLRPWLGDDVDAAETWVAHGLAVATDGIDSAGLIVAARADLQRRAGHRAELTPL